MHILITLWFVVMICLFILLSIQKIKDWYNSTPDYVRQIDLEKKEK
jgi:hypothetical protein